MKELRDSEKRANLDRLVERLSEGSLTRRDFIKGGLALGFSLAFLSGIASRHLQAFAQGVPSDLLEAVEKEGKKLNIFNWADYIHPDIIPMFEKEYGVEVTYDTFGSESELLTKIQAGGAIYDVVVPTQDYGYIMWKSGLIQPLNHDWIPNMKNLMSRFVNPSYDPGNKYEMPWLWGFTIFVYNSKYVDLPFTDSWWLLFMGPLFRKELVRKVAMMNEFPNEMYPALRLLGHSLNTTEKKDLMEMKEIMLAQKPWVTAYLDGAVVLKQVISEDVWLAKLWNGKAKRAGDENSAVKLVIPREGYEMWADQMAVVAGCPHPAAAHLFINYIMNPKIGAMNANYNKYATPYEASLPYIDPEDRADPAIYPSEEEMKIGEFALPHPMEVRKIYEGIWEKLVG